MPQYSPPMCMCAVLTLAVFTVLPCPQVHAEPLLLPNASFEQGTGLSPRGWELSGEGAWDRGGAPCPDEAARGIHGALRRLSAWWPRRRRSRGAAPRGH